MILQVNRDFFHPNANPLGLRDPKALELVHAYADLVPVQALRGLLRSPLLECSTLDCVVRSTSNPFNRTVGLEQQFSATRSNNLIGYNGKDVRIAIFDSGAADYEDLGGKIERQVDFTSGQAVIYRNKIDPYGHGTHVDGILGGKGSASQGPMPGSPPKRTT